MTSDKWRQWRVLSGLLALIEATSLIFLDFYILGVYHALSSLPPVGSQFPQVYLGASLMALSAISLILGGCLIIRSEASISGAVFLVSGAVVPIPVYLYFAGFSEPTILSWLGSLGGFLFAPGVISGLLSILIISRKIEETKKCGRSQNLRLSP
ncbi:hypothetical protein KAU25_04325 [Candidatus Bathyarchaeota archaeon]|nr:hypothetical protein [Candidatus Bathyarchaeota archaeon]